MSTKTSIAWTDVTDNIIVVEGGGWWCRMCSPGCLNCYAAALNQNGFYGGNKLAYSGDPPGTMVLRIDIIDGWAKQTKAKRHFVASMTDVFGEWIFPNEAHRFLTGMLKAPKQTFQVLTKRPQHARNLIMPWLDYHGLDTLPPNVWLGVSVEDQKRADERIPILLSIPAKVRFLSVEPILEPIDLSAAVGLWEPGEQIQEAGGGSYTTERAPKGPFVDWVIVGGESGKDARPCNIEWIRSVVGQCKAAGVPCFVKQLGANAAFGEWAHWRTKHPKGGDITEFPEDLRVRQFPQGVAHTA